MKPKVLISAPYMIREKEKVLSLLNGHNLELHWASVSERLNEEDLLPVIGEYDGIICGDDRLTRRVLDQAKRLKAIVKWGTGIDSIDKKYAGEKGIPVLNTPNAFTNPVADTTLGIMLYFVRGLGVNQEIMARGGWDKPQTRALSELTVGIIGLGNIGSAVAKRLSAFGTRVLANDIAEKPADLVAGLGVIMSSKEMIYAEADIISLHCDLNETSFHVLNAESFAQMQRKPVIINCARGPLIDELALLAALQIGLVSAAGLDVFEVEPLPGNSPLRKMKNVLLSSHNSNSSPSHWQHVHKNSIELLVEALHHD